MLLSTILGHFVENVEFLCEQSTFRTIGVDFVAAYLDSCHRATMFQTKFNSLKMQKKISL